LQSSFVVFNCTAVVVSHDEGAADLSYQSNVFALSLKSTLVVLDSLLRLLDVHKRLGYHLKVLNARLCVKDFKVASGVIITILQFIKVDLSLLLLCLDEASISRLNLLQHVECLLGIAHLHGKIRLGKHDANLLRSIRELGNRLGQSLFSHIEHLVFAVNRDQVKENASTLLLSKWKSELLLEVRVTLNTAWVSNSGQLKCMLKSCERILPILADDLNLGLHQHEDWVLSS